MASHSFNPPLLPCGRYLRRKICRANVWRAAQGQRHLWTQLRTRRAYILARRHAWLGGLVQVAFLLLCACFLRPDLRSGYASCLLMQTRLPMSVPFDLEEVALRSFGRTACVPRVSRCWETVVRGTYRGAHS